MGYRPRMWKCELEDYTSFARVFWFWVNCTFDIVLERLEPSASSQQRTGRFCASADGDLPCALHADDCMHAELRPGSDPPSPDQPLRGNTPVFLRADPQTQSADPTPHSAVAFHAQVYAHVVPPSRSYQHPHPHSAGYPRYLARRYMNSRVYYRMCRPGMPFIHRVSALAGKWRVGIFTAFS